MIYRGVFASVQTRLSQRLCPPLCFRFSKTSIYLGGTCHSIHDKNVEKNEKIVCRRRLPHCLCCVLPIFPGAFGVYLHVDLAERPSTCRLGSFGNAHVCFPSCRATHGRLWKWGIAVLRYRDIRVSGLIPDVIDWRNCLSLSYTHVDPPTHSHSHAYSHSCTLTFLSSTVCVWGGYS